jgi:hypothetical protein
MAKRMALSTRYQEIGTPFFSRFITAAESIV